MFKSYARYLIGAALMLAAAGPSSAQFRLPKPTLPIPKPNASKGGGNPNDPPKSGGKDVVTISRDLQPAINLEHTRISVQAETVGGIPGQYLQQLKTRLVTAIQADSRFTVEDRSPETIIKLTATNLDLKHGPPSNNKQVTVTHVTGLLRVSFQAIDANKKTPLDSANLEAGFDRQYYSSSPAANSKNEYLGAITSGMAEQPPSATDVLNILIDNITAQVTHRIARTKGTLEFKLPGGELKAYNDKMRNKEWVSLYDDLYTMKEPGKPEDRAERLYWMGIAKEAAAYDIKDKNESRKSFLDADRHYQDAAALQTKDAGTYKDSARRTEEAIVLLAGATPNAGGGSGDSGGARSADSEALNNDYIIQLLKNGMSESMLIDVISDAKTTAFDVTPSGLVRLTKEKVPEKVIKAMREKNKKN